ncbi:UDP-galactose-lipid carrier transferase [Actinokineospora spheciospongiae]|uniref:UDP-galactose-lipid carrier transferase n=1 Tax=Actinokineospora spheciospongiae TaxID=909613 RepID=W7IMP8_9PSEU|nr:polyphosphate kinase 2 family protein [Actinokineospora spheciospongiae]EWC61648.1 UDP-galactose-lipid carrier transferase [Actinokineospora spheciospongiae]
MAKKTVPSVRDALRVRPGSGLHLGPRDTPVGPATKAEAADLLAATGERLAVLQEALYAESRRSVLLVLQGMDTSGKGGTVSHVCGLVNPQGLRVTSFKAPTRQELRHDFLWRVRKQVPPPGYIGVFDRSHYEDVLIARVQELVPREVWDARYFAINEFEAELAEAGTTVVKVFLHISPEEQRERLIARLETPAKQWKYDPADLVARSRWTEYEEAYRAALERCGTAAAPWYIVPADRKWYRNWAVASVLLETLEELAPTPPEPTYDVAAELARITYADPWG